MTKIIKVEEKDSAFNYGDMHGEGFDGITSADLALPFIKLLQMQTPELKGLKEAEAGDFYNTITKEVTPGSLGIVAVPVYYEEIWVEWKPQNGGIVASHDPHSTIVQDVIRNNGGSVIPPKDVNGKTVQLMHGKNDIVQTFYLYVIILNDDGTEVNSFALIPCTATKIKSYRGLLTSMFMLKGKPPIFANRFRLKSVEQLGNGQSFFNFSISSLRETWLASLIDPINEAHIIKEAQVFRKRILDKEVLIDYDDKDHQIQSGVSEDDVPF
jgi:hypothetical protein